MTIGEMIEFLETDTLSYEMSPGGLRYLSLRIRPGLSFIDLRAVGPKPTKEPDEETIIGETLSFLETGKHAMPLDLSGFTEFQREVFRAVSSIESGEIITYKGIAEKLGKPGGAQAVGNAVAKNPVSYFLPTHRVIPQKGIGICRTGAGYLKEKLLAREGHDLSKLRGNYVCTREKCCQE